MPLVLEAARVRCAVVGNHDFDHGPVRRRRRWRRVLARLTSACAPLRVEQERLAELVEACSFPWLLSNVQAACEGEREKSVGAPSAAAPT